MLMSLTFVLVGTSLFVGLLPTITGNYSDQRFLVCAISWALLCLALGKLVIRPQQSPRMAYLLWLLPFVLVFLSGELYPATFHVEPLMFAFFFSGALLYGSQLSGFKNFAVGVRQALTLIALLALIYGLIAVLNYGLALRDGNREVDTTVTWGFPNIRYWSHLATWLIPLFAIAQQSGSLSKLPLVRALLFLSGAIWWWMIFTTSARGSAVGLIVGSAVVIALFKRSSLGWLRVMGKQLLGGGFLWLVLTVLVPWLVFGSADLRELRVHSSGRLPLWQEAWEMSLVNFPFGLGPQSWLTHETLTDAYKLSNPFAHPHNMYLLWAAEYGWVSLAALLIAVFGVCRSLVGVNRRLESAEGKDKVIVGLTASVVAAFTHASVSAVFMAPASMLVGLLVLTLFSAHLSMTSEFSQGGGIFKLSTQSLRLSAGLLLVVCGLIGGFWMSEVWHYYEGNMLDRQTYQGQGAIYSPRFWSHGDFPRQ